MSAAVSSHTPVRTVMASPAVRASKRARQDTGGYRAEKWSEHLEAEVSAFVRSFEDEDANVKPAKRQRQPTGKDIGLYDGLLVCLSGGVEAYGGWRRGTSLYIVYEKSF